MARYLYSEIATALQAYQNCVESGNTEWRDKWEERIETLCAEHLPSGSGFDNGTKLRIECCRPKLKGHVTKLVFQTSFHHMNESGMYDGWTNHLVTLTPSLVHKFYLRISGINRNDIKSYISDTFHEALSMEVSTEVSK